MQAKKSICLRACFLVVCLGGALVADDDTIKGQKMIVVAAIRHLDDEQEIDVGDIESVLRDIDPSSPFHPIAVQAASFLYVKRREYSKAWRLLSHQSAAIQNEPLSLQLGHDRLMLWLLLESGQVEKATELFKKLVKQLISNEELSNSEKKILANFLGKICGMAMADDDPKLLPKETVNKAVSLIEESHVRFAITPFRSQLTETQSQSNELTSIQSEINRVSEQEAMLALEQAHDDKNTFRSAFEESIVRQESEGKKLRGLRTDLKNQEKTTRYIWYLRYHTSEPGYPSKPEPPSSGKKPKGSRYDKDADKRAWDEYDQKESTYPTRRREYENELKSYPQRLRDWEARNQERDKKLTIQLEQAATQLAQVRALEDQQRQDFDEAVASKTDNEKKLHRAERRARFLEASIEEKSRGNMRSVHRPSRFSILDYQAEMERLMSNTRAAIFVP
jgi:hypothetical protein